MSSPEIILVHRVADLEHHHLDWKRLLAQTPGATFFQSLDWLLATLRDPAPRQEPRVLLVYDRGEAVGVLPLVLKWEATRLGVVRTLTYPLDDWGTFYGPLGADPERTLTAGMRFLNNIRREWDLLDLRWVDADGTDQGRTRQALAAAGIAARESLWRRTALVECGGSWEGYLAGRSAELRSQMRRSQRRCEELGEVTLERYRPRGAAWGETDPRLDLYDACVEVARKSWQAESSTGTTLCHPRLRQFLRDRQAAAARAGALDVCLLRIGGRPAAFAYNYHAQGRLVGLRTGYDRSLAKAGPGVLLYTLMLRDSFARNDVLLDLGAGHSDAKRRWQTHDAASFRYTHYPLTAPRAQLLRVKHWLFGQRETAEGKTPVQS